MKKILLFAAAMLAFAGCKEDEPVEPPVPQEPDEISVTSDNPVELGNEGGAFDVTLATDTEGAELVAADFEVETSADWLTFNAPATGNATSATLNFTAEANTEEGAPARSADITVS